MIPIFLVYAFIVPLFVQRSTAPNETARRRCRGATDTAVEAGRDGPVQEEFAPRLNNRPGVPGRESVDHQLVVFWGSPLAKTDGAPDQLSVERWVINPSNYG